MPIDSHGRKDSKGYFNTGTYTAITWGHREVIGMISRAQRVASRRWIRRNYDLITLRVPKGQRDQLKACAASTGESMNGLIRRAVRELAKRGGFDLMEV